MVAGVSVEKGAVRELRKLGVKDSKLLTPDQRNILYAEIPKFCNNIVALHIEPQEIDSYVTNGKKYRKLNYLEAIYMAKVADGLNATEVYVDAADINPRRFSEEITKMVSSTSRIIAQHHADRKYAVVSAASIVAKVERDRAVELLRAEHGEFGSGYPSDRRTVVFLADWLKRNNSFPAFSRRSWKTWERIRQNHLL